MKRPFEAWRRSLALWGLPVGFCLLNLLILGFYFSFYAGEVERLEAGNRSADERLAELRRQSEEIEAFLARADGQLRGVEDLYAERFQTEAQRFTRAIQEVKKLARDAGLAPTSFSYPQRVLDEQGLIQREIQFSVVGTYRQLRTFINFLELTDQFLALSGVALSEGGADRLSIQLQLSTVFAADTSDRGGPDRGGPASRGSEPDGSDGTASGPADGDATGEAT